MLVIQSILLSVGIDALRFLKSIFLPYLYDGETFDVEEENVIELIGKKSFSCTLDEFGLKFWPPLYVQRYMTIKEVLEHPIWNGSIKKVVDFGCAEFGLFKFIKQIRGLNNIMCVDTDFSLLDLNQTKVLPTNYDHVSMAQRNEPLTVDIYNGSIAELDDRMLDIDAVICIELIEHLYSDVLNAVPHTVFEFIKPKLALFTTPNVEFNVLFPNFTQSFRHEDHKFEWTRKQFKKWAKNITACYPDYAVQIDGIGAGPSGTENLGCCSQMALFYRKDLKTSPVEPIGSTPYKLLRRVSYPFELYDENVVRERLMNGILSKFVTEAGFNDKCLVDGHLEIPLDIIMPHVSHCFSSIDELEKFVSKLYSTKKDEQGKWIMLADSYGISSEDEYKSDSDSISNHSGQYYLLENSEMVHQDVDIDWDTSNDISFSESKYCYSTPMANNLKPNDHFSNTDSFNTVLSNSDLFKTAVDHIKREDHDMEISSSCNSSFIVDDCNIYQDFLKGRNNTTVIDSEDREAEKTITCVSNHQESLTENDLVNSNVFNDYMTVIENSNNVSLRSSCSSSDSAKELISENGEDCLNNYEKNDQLLEFTNRTLLDESGYTEKLLSIPDKTLNEVRLRMFRKLMNAEGIRKKKR